MKLLELVPDIRAVILNSAAATIAKNCDRPEYFVDFWNQVLSAEYESGRSLPATPVGTSGSTTGNQTA